MKSPAVAPFGADQVPEMLTFAGFFEDWLREALKTPSAETDVRVAAINAAAALAISERGSALSFGSLSEYREV